MNNENKDNPDFEETENFDDFEDAFEDDFNVEKTTEAPAETAKESAIDRPEKKKGAILPVIIGLAVLFFFGWKLVQYFGADPEEPLETKEAPPVAVATPEIQTIATPEIQPIVNPVVEPAIQEKLVTLPPPAPSVEEMATKDKAHQEKIQLLEKELALTKQSAENTSRVVAGLTQEISTLTHSVQQLSDQIDTLRDNQERALLKRDLSEKEHAKTSKRKYTAPHSAQTDPSLTVYAIIPGRAWLRSSNGKTITVSEGDTLAEYGKVLKIDASNGVVVTTSGVTLR